MSLIKVQKFSELTEEQKKERIAPRVKINTECTCPENCPFNCKGECGCQVCHEAYMDYLSLPEA
jgi:hypothetical protein